MDLMLPDHLSERHREILGSTADDLDLRFGVDLVGLVLSGSAGRGIATNLSDLDLILIMEPAIVHGPAAPSLHTAELELIPLTLEHAHKLAPYGSADYAYRWSWAWAPVLLDRTGGQLTAAVDRQRRLDVAESLDVLIGHEGLGRWLNFSYRALKSSRAGRVLATRLDAAEALPVFLDIVFALDGSVRPYGSYLPWVLEHHPVSGWENGDLLEVIEGMLGRSPDALVRGVEMVEQRSLSFASQHSIPSIPEAFDEWRGDDYGAVLGLRSST